MPTPETDAPAPTASSDQQDIACSLLTPPPEDSTQQPVGAPHSIWHQCPASQEKDLENVTMTGAVADNTAVGMSLVQEDNMYASAVLQGGGDNLDGAVAKDNGDATSQENGSTNQVSSDKESTHSITHLSHHVPGTPSESDSGLPNIHETGITIPRESLPSPSPTENDDAPEVRTEMASRSDEVEVDPAASKSDHTTTINASRKSEVDDVLNHSSEIQPWDFSNKRLIPQYPSALLQPYAKFCGTQHSDHQVYNVEVTILTVDMEQSSMSGYLEICGLTPDHPTLTTFFTGEIIGGPDQKYSFRTKDPSWGASDKTDITHWVKFLEWRPLTPHAKRNINFVYPLDGQGWWQQEHIFMRWKEHFLVPDYKLRSIQGASFEGFYYICFNQVEGRISGMYFHSKSEKYQQLELKHEGQRGVWGRGVTPSVEFR